MKVRYDWYYKSLNKHNEELCGDVVKIHDSNESFIAVLSDGLGSGVKANILATLTAEIIKTMLKEGIDINETISTVTSTLPICKERGIAYSTFTVIHGMKNGKVKIINFDNPKPVVVIDGTLDISDPVVKEMDGKKIQVWEYDMKPSDFIVVFSDGVMYAGIGGLLNFGWGWENISDYILKIFRKKPFPRSVAENILEIVHRYYDFKCQDDATILCVMLKPSYDLIIFTGPPLDPKDDEKIVKEFLSFDGKKVICSGTTANIVSRFVEKELALDISTARTDIPPMGKLEGVDLVTEGVLTLTKTIETLRKCNFNEDQLPKDRNAAVELSKLIINADKVKIIMGQKLNPFYQNPDLPKNISIRKKIIDELTMLLRNHGKEVEVKYC